MDADVGSGQDIEGNQSNDNINGSVSRLRVQVQSSNQDLESRDNSRSNTSMGVSAKVQPRSRSSSRIRKPWNSKNAFINFMQEFRQLEHINGANALKLGGEYWRKMSGGEKRPFIDAANRNKKLETEQRQQSRTKHQTPRNIDNHKLPIRGHRSMNYSVHRKRKLSQQEVRDKPKSKRIRNAIESDTDSSSGSIHNATTDDESANLHD